VNAVSIVDHALKGAMQATDVDADGYAWESMCPKHTQPATDTLSLPSECKKQQPTTTEGTTNSRAGIVHKQFCRISGSSVRGQPHIAVADFQCHCVPQTTHTLGTKKPPTSMSLCASLHHSEAEHAQARGLHIAEP
jgi:hypothetical protein